MSQIVTKNLPYFQTKKFFLNNNFFNFKKNFFEYQPYLINNQNYLKKIFKVYNNLGC